MMLRVSPAWWTAVVFVALAGCADEPRPTPFFPPGLGSGAGTDGGDDEAGDTDPDGDDGASDGGSDTDGADAGPGSGGSGPLAVGISVASVQANQGVAVEVAASGAAIPAAGRNAELIHGRVTLLRAHWELDAGWSAREIVGVLEVTYADGSTEVFEDSKPVDGAGNPSSIGGAFAWELPADAVRPGMRYQIKLTEGEGTAREGSSAGAVFPAQGPTELGVTPDAMSMSLVLVPVTTPEGGVVFDDHLTNLYTDRMFATYPLQDIHVEVRSPWASPTRISSLETAFNYLTQLRVQDGAGPDVYYHLVMDYATCCSGDEMQSWAGMGSVVDDAGYVPREGISKISMELPEYWEWDVDTMVHEVGHNHGREHAPCGDPGTPDAAYPYPEAGIGVAGYDIDHQVLIDPSQVDETWGMPTTDFMSYCTPQWWSDYSWQALIERVRLITQAQSAGASVPWDRELLRGFVHADGSVSWSRIPAPSIGSGTRPGVGTMRLRDGSGAMVAESVVYERRLADVDVRVLEAEVPPLADFERFEVDFDRGDRLEAAEVDVTRVTTNWLAP